LGQLIGELVTAAIALGIVRPKLPGRQHLPLLVDALRFSVALVPAAIAGFVFDASDRIVVNADLGAGAVGRYAVARNLGGFVLVLLQLVTLVWMPRLFAMTDAAARRSVLARSRDGIYALTVTFAIAISAAAPLLLALWAPPSYHPAHLLLVMALVAACGFPSADALIYTQALILGARTAAVAVISVSVAMLNLALNITLVPVLGIDGSAAITLGCYSLGALITRWWVGPGGPPTNWRPLLLAVGGVAVCISLAAVPPSGVVALAFRLVIAAAATITFFVALRVLVRSDGA
jgi:O-antigen/teichoic acid export membrane protein